VKNYVQSIAVTLKYDI